MSKAGTRRPPAGPLIGSVFALCGSAFGFAYAIAGADLPAVPVGIVCATTALGMVVTLFAMARRPLHVRARVAGHVVRVVPLVVGPLVAAPGERLTVTTAGFAAGLVTAVWFGRLFAHAAARRAAVTPGRSARELDKTALARAMNMLFISGVVACTGVAVVAIMASPGGSHEESILSTIMLLVCGVLTIVAGISLARSPGRDLVSMSRRLDALGSQTEATMASHFAITSFDGVGGLFQDLESLRLRLAEQVALYQDALERTRAADDEKQRFLAAVSHELRTPLNVIEGYAQLLLEGHPDPLSDEQAEDVRLIRAGGNQLLALINDILDIAMIESGELRLNFAREELGPVLQEIVDVQLPLVHGRPVEVLADLGELPPVTCDRRRVWQIVTNLVSNAVKFTEEGSVTVRARSIPENNAIAVQVLDTGVGIAADELDAVFEEFRQVGNLKARSKGTGLGLAIARSIAEAHGGTLTADSVLGDGSTFTLVLPFAPPDLPQRIDMVEARARAEETRRRRTAETTGDVATFDPEEVQ